MYFDLTDEQEAIRSTARDFLASRFKSERMREIAGAEDGTDEQGWTEMAELGWAGLGLTEEGGAQAVVDAGSTATPGAFPMKAEAEGDGIVLDGKKQLVADAAGAAFFLVAT